VAFGSNRDLDKNNHGQATRLAQQGAQAISGGAAGARADAVSGDGGGGGVYVYCAFVPCSPRAFERIAVKHAVLWTH
jgi:hypothetical protein